VKPWLSSKQIEEITQRLQEDMLEGGDYSKLKQDMTIL